MTSSSRSPSPPRGWYADPSSPGRERYWDGAGWTQIVRRLEVIEPKRGGIQKVYGPNPVVSSRQDPAQALPLAAWSLRVASGAIDYLVTGALLAGILAVVGRSWVSHMVSLYADYTRDIIHTLQAGSLSFPAPSAAYSNGVLTLTLLFGGVITLYTTIFLGTWGATIGQRAAGLRVIKAPLPMSVLPPDLKIPFTVEKLGWMRAISKGLAWALLSAGGSIFIIAQVINVFLPLFTKRKQSLTDLFANTLTVSSTLKDDESDSSQ